MKSKYVNGTINKDIYIHTDSNTEHRVDELEKEIVLKQDKLTAGENITISEDNVISSVGGGAEVFVIHITNGDASTITVTKAEVIEAIENNQPIVIDYERTNSLGRPSTHYITAPVAVMTSQFLSREYELEGRVANPVDSEYRFYSISFNDMADFSFHERFIQSVSTVNSESTDEQIPTAKAVYDAIIANGSGSFYDSVIYYNDNATFNDEEAYLGEFNILADTSELKVTIGDTEYTLKKYTDGEHYAWVNEDHNVEIWNDGNVCYIWAENTNDQTLPVKIEGQVLNSEFASAVNDAVTYYDVYLDNQVITFNEQGIAELGSFNLNPEQTPKLLMTIDGTQEQLVYTWNGEVYVNEEDETIIGEEDGTWFLGPGTQGSIRISLSSADVKSDFKDAVLSVSGGSQVEIFDVTYQKPKSDIYGLYTLMDDKTIEDIYNTYDSGKTVLIRYNRQNDEEETIVQDNGAIKYIEIPSGTNTVVVWTVESIQTNYSDFPKGINPSVSYTIITNAVEFIDDEGNECYVRLKCDSAGGSSNQFTGYSEESGSSNVSFMLTSAAPKGQIDGEPTSWYLTDKKTFEDVYNAFMNGKTVYLVAPYNQIYNTYQVTSALHDGGSSKGPYDSYTIYAESFAGIDANGNVQMKYLQVEQGYDGTGTPFTLYNKTISNGGVETISYGAVDADEICTLLDSGKEVKVSHNGLIYDLHSLYGSDKYKSSVVSYGVQSDTDVPFLAWKVDRISNDYSQIQIAYSCYLTQSIINDDFGCAYGQIGVWLILNDEYNSVIKDTLYDTLINIPSDTKSGIIESKMSPYTEVTAQLTGPLNGGQSIEVNEADFNFHNQYGFYIVFALLDSKVSGMSYIATVGGIDGYNGIDWDPNVVSDVEPEDYSNAIVLHGLQAMVNHPGHADCWFSNSNEVFNNLTLNTDPDKDFNYIDMVNPSQAESKWVKFRQTSDNSFRNITVEDNEWFEEEIKIVDLVPIPDIPTVTTFYATYDSGLEAYVLGDNKTIQDLYNSIKDDIQTFVGVYDGFNVTKFQMGSANKHLQPLLGVSTFSVSGYCLDAQNPSGLTANCIYAYKANADSTLLYMTSQYIGNAEQ